MKRLLRTATALMFLPMLGVARSSAQSMDDLNLQIHGYATQGSVYSTSNNWNTTASTDGSAAWTEAVLNVTAQPQSRLRFGVQARYYLLGTYGNQITLDWAEADVKINEKFGFRIGKVKTPMNLLNETQDIDPAHLWILLPQSIYPLAGRNSNLAINGLVGYGAVELGESLGKLEYRAFAGQRVLASDDGSLAPFTNHGFLMPNGLAGRVFGGVLRWRTPIAGLMVGASEESDNPSGKVTMGPMQGAISATPLSTPYFFARYERNKVMAAGEYGRVAPHGSILLDGIPAIYTLIDERLFYGMASYKLAEKLTVGMYYSSAIDRQAAFNSDRYQKDWALSGRYDFSPFLYLKAEQHFVEGTLIGYSTSNNTGGLKPNSRMTLLKLGVSF